MSYVGHIPYNLSKISEYSDFETHPPVKVSNKGMWTYLNIPRLAKLAVEKLSN